MNLIWFFVIIFLVLLFAGCAAVFMKFKTDPPPDAIIIVMDVHGNKDRYALDHIKGLKVMLRQGMEYEFEWIVEKELDLGEERQHVVRN